MKTINAGIIGMGFIGIPHLDAIRRMGNVNVKAISDINYDAAKAKASRYGIPKCYKDYDDLINDPEIDVIHNCTPNFLHLDINGKCIEAGKSIFSEKPLGKDYEDSSQMMAILEKHPEVVTGVNFCYRMTPLVQDMKHRIRNGEIGKIYLIHGSYLQDWLLYDTDYNWRVDPEFAGSSRCVADIGSHWIDTAQTVLGSKVISVCADLVTAIPVRKKPLSEVETYVISKDVEYSNVNISSEDFGNVFLKFENGVTGVFLCSQISAGRKCFLNVEVDGSKASFYWNQETSDRMWKGNRDTYNEEVFRNPLLMASEVADYTYMPAGHPEGWNDALRNAIFAFYKYIIEEKKPGIDTPDFATFEEGHYITRVTEAIVKSSNERRWVNVNEII